jgi:hypothetical protein
VKFNFCSEKNFGRARNTAKHPCLSRFVTERRSLPRASCNPPPTPGNFIHRDLPAGLEVQSLIREIGLIDEADLEDKAFYEIELEFAQGIAKAYDVVTDKEDLSEETNKRAATLVPDLPTGS